MDSLDDLEPETTGLQALIKQYNSLVDKKRNLLSQRVAMGKSATAKRMAAYKKLLEPMLPNFIASQGLSENTLTFAGRTKGTNSKRLYLLISADGGKTYWVRIDNDHLVASQVKQKHRFLK